MGGSLSAKIADNELEAVKAKLNNLDWKAKSEPKITMFANILSDTELFQEKFFDAKKYLIKDLKEMMDIGVVKMDTDVNNNSGIYKQGSNKDFDKEFEKEIQEVQEAQQARNSWRVKLILTEMQTDELAVGIFVPLGRPKKNRYGMLHAALQIGPWMLEWNKSNLVVPRAVSSKYAVFVADVEFWSGQIVQEQMIEKVCKVCVDWNIHRKYDLNHSNCQTFVDEVLKELGHDKPFFEQGKLGATLKSIQNGSTSLVDDNGHLRFEYQYDERSEKHIITTHKELDDLCYSMIGVRDDPKQPEFPSDHFLLLRAFDRAFWLRFMDADSSTSTDYTAEERFEILHKCKESSRECYFGNPKSSGTILEENNKKKSSNSNGLHNKT